jgi:hypothetical protein
MTFLQELRQQRWDDHRYYHHNRINQTLHFLSALCFLTSYVLIFFNPVAAVLIGWLLAMLLRQAGHFFFEPLDYDKVNLASQEHKESIKVGYNLRRKIILLSVWICAPGVLFIDPTLMGLFVPHQDFMGFVNNIAILWLFVGFGALIFRTAHLFFLMGVQSGLVWLTKILTDPFHDVYIYHKAPIHWWRGEMYDDMSEWYETSLVEELEAERELAPQQVAAG